jgi:hypothetical protein
VGIRVTKEQGVMISASTLVSMVGSLAAVWVFASPIVAEQLEEKIKKQLGPVNSALELSTMRSITQLRSTISALNFKLTECAGRPGCWTLQDQRDLDNADADLVTAEAVLKSLRENQ